MDQRADIFNLTFTNKSNHLDQLLSTRCFCENEDNWIKDLSHKQMSWFYSNKYMRFWETRNKIFNITTEGETE